MTHTILNIAPDGQIIGTAFVAETQVAGTVAAMKKAGQEAVVLPWMRLSTEHSMLVWDRETREIRKRSATMAELRAPLLSALANHHGTVTQAPITYAGYVFDGDAKSQSTVQAFALRIRAGEKNPHGGTWRLKDNSEIEFVDDDVLALDTAMQGRNRDALKRVWMVKRMIRQDDETASLKAFDIAAAWNEVEV